MFVLWLISPYTRGASFLYRKFVHPLLVRHEKDIDDYLIQAKEHGYTAIVGLGSRGFMYAREIVASAAVKGQLHLVNQLRKSYSVGDLSRSDDEHDDGSEQHQQRTWQGYYDDGGRLVEEEFQYLYSDDNAGPKSRPALRQSTRRTVATRSITSGYSTLPRRRRRDGTL
ncbi:hypothetical protein D918_00733 [Trichuris suis]|nr:hypothetical protein D918_00733 [Trichuris suis]